ncbi:hypothetical protein [Oleiharenicola lentus]|uniref:hypothetical protein n=1 Tax=Oleiharenicola lentus TaxID=2508720 RepID=UPI003F665570
MKPPPSHSLVNQVVILTLVLLVCGGTLGLGAVWARQGISQSANRSRSLEVKIADVERRIDEVNAEVAQAIDATALRKQNEVMKLALVSPREIQVQRVDQSPTLYLARKRNQEIFNIASSPRLDVRGTTPVATAPADSTRIVFASLR